MILYLVATYTSIFNTLHTASGLFLLNQCMKLFGVIRKFLAANIFRNFLLILLHLSIQVLTSDIRNFEPFMGYLQVQ